MLGRGADDEDGVGNDDVDVGGTMYNGHDAEAEGLVVEEVYVGNQVLSVGEE